MTHLLKTAISTHAPVKERLYETVAAVLQALFQLTLL